MITKRKGNAIGNSKFENQLNDYMTWENPDNIDFENMELINLSIADHNREFPDDQKRPIETKFYNDYGNNFATDIDKANFRQYLKDFDGYSFVNLSGKPVIIKPYYEKGLLKYEFSSVNDFKTFHRQDKFDVLNGKKVETVYFADQWIETGEMRKRYKNTVFDPSDKHSSDSFNFWKGFIEPIKGDHQPFIDHINKLIKGTQADKEYIIDLLAYSVRHPDRLTGVALAFRGVQGAGKSTVSETMKELCPNHSKPFDSMDTFV